MDDTFAKNYWRSVFVRASEGQFSQADFDKWFPGAPGNGDFNDQLLEAFAEMLKACAEGKFGKPAPRGDR